MIEIGIDIGEYDDLRIRVSRKNLCIIDGYRIKSKKQMKQILQYVFSKTSIYSTHRNINSLIKEWRTHNIFYKMGFFKNHTKDCDLGRFEFPLHTLFYFIIGSF